MLFHFFQFFLSNSKKHMMSVYKTVSLLQQIDEYIHSQLREKNADRLQQLQHGYVECVFVCLFSGSVPLLKILYLYTRIRFKLWL